MKSQIDHLIVVARTLEQGAQWCEETLGIAPGPSDAHAKHGTYNHLFKIASPRYPLAYFEIIAIDPNGKSRKAVTSKRWFDMDDEALRAAVTDTPRLVHFVAQIASLQEGRNALKALEIDRGPAEHDKRHTRKGVLQWQMTVRDDGQRLFNGALPSLIQWGKADDAEPLRLHHRNSLPRSGVTLDSLHISHPSADKLQAAYTAIGLEGVTLDTGPANLRATLRTPKGVVALDSLGI